MSVWSKPRPVVSYLAALFVVLSVPLLGIAAWATLRYAAAERAGLEQQAHGSVAHVSAVVERELARHIATLQALATSPALDGDLGRFHAQASELTGTGGVNIVLDALDGQQLLNTRVPWGGALPQGPLQPVHRAVLETGRPQVSDLVTGPATRRLLVVVSIPVQRAGRVDRLLSMALPVETLTALLVREALPEPYVTVIADRTGAIMTRSVDADVMAGKPLSGFRDLRGSAGVWTGTNVLGVPILGVWARSPFTGWTVGTSIAEATLNAPLRRSLWLLIGSGLGLALAGGLLALVIAGQVARSARGVSDLARAMGEGRSVEPRPLPVKEAVLVGEALAAASAGLRQRDAALQASQEELRRANADLEERVEARTSALRQSEERYRLLAENTSDVIVMGHLDGRRSYVSPAVRAVLGYTPDQAQDLGMRDLVHPDDIERVYAATRGLTPERPDASVTHRAKHRNGHWIWLEAAYRLGEESTVVASMRDVTARHQAAEELGAAKVEAERARVDAEAAARAKTDFLATMSHEIRTPLNGILGFTDLILDRQDLAPDLRRQVGLVATAGNALLTVVNDVLDLSKIEAGGIALEACAFAVESLIDSTALIVRSAAQAKGLLLTVDVDPHVPAWLEGDENRLRQVLLNYLNNAVKFTKTGQVSLDVRCEGNSDAGAQLLFAVTDTGMGIPLDAQARLFQRFSQMDGSISREFGGTGLGLAICRQIVELMGGTVGVESRPGKGSTFWCRVSLPVAQAAMPAAASTDDRRRGRAAGRILVVDDTAMNREVAKAVLEGAGYTVEVVGDGPSGIEAVRNGAFDLVLMDVQMPGMTGVTATQHIRDLPAPMCSIPVVAMTANVLPDQVAEFKRAGMNDHVAKPINRGALFAVVERWIETTRCAENGVAPATVAATSFFDAAAHDQLVALLGRERVRGYLETFRSELAASFASAPTSAETARALASEAHMMTAQAGMMGFATLSRACRRLDELGGANADVADALADVREARAAVLKRLDSLLAELAGAVETSEPMMA